MSRTKSTELDFNMRQVQQLAHRELLDAVFDSPSDEDEINEFSDPFDILAAREEAAGESLVFLTMEHDD